MSMDERPLDNGHRGSSRFHQFFRLFMDCDKRLYAVILMLVHNPDDAEDLFQETALVMWERFDDFQMDKSFLAWGIGIARHKYIDLQRKKRTMRTRLEQKTYELILDHAVRRADQMPERSKALQTCVRKLVDADRKLIAMRYHQNLSVKAMATQLQRSRDGLYKTMARIHRQLERCVKTTLSRLEAI